jgi:hypothetical protein
MLALNWREMEDRLQLFFARLRAGQELLPTEPTGTSPATMTSCKQLDQMPCLRSRVSPRDGPPAYGT